MTSDSRMRIRELGKNLSASKANALLADWKSVKVNFKTYRTFSQRIFATDSSTAKKQEMIVFEFCSKYINIDVLILYLSHLV